MANKKLFASPRKPVVPVAKSRNAAGGVAYDLSSEEALAQFAVTGCLNGTFYAGAEVQLDTVIGLATKCTSKVIADVAIYSRKSAHMKDMPALLLAILAGRGNSADREEFGRAAPLVLDNGRMVRNFAQMIRSGKFGRKSFGTMAKRAIRNYLETATSEKLFRDSVGNDPSLADVIKMTHPKASSKEKDALFGYLIGSKKFDAKKARFLPMVVKEMERFKAGDGPMPEAAPFMMLTAHATGENAWLRLLQRASWTETRMNLNAFQKHGALAGADVVRMVAARLRDPDAIRKSRAFPYQLMTAYQHTASVPQEIRNALQDALEVATENIPNYGEGVVVAVDVSGSMDAAVTGARGSVSSVTTCRDVAALIAASVLRTSKNAEILAFSTRVDSVQLNPRDSIVTNAAVLKNLPSGGTDCALPLRLLNQTGAQVNLVIYASDNESWAGPSVVGATGMMAEWVKLKKRCPNAKLVCIDLVPNTTAQVAADKDILRVGGFSDSVFDVIENFRKGNGSFLDLIRTEALVD